VPLVILTPVPLTLIGIMIGHWLFGAPFSATSMIGFIALAGIIVRNSILLVDFIRTRCSGQDAADPGADQAGAIRFKPILLTATCGHDRGGGDPDRPDLPGAGDLAAVRAGLVNGADRAGDPGDLPGAQDLSLTVTVFI
jgi:predicted lipid-binding transport protein (Tim44 family)